MHSLPHPAHLPAKLEHRPAGPPADVFLVPEGGGSACQLPSPCPPTNRRSKELLPQDAKVWVLTTSLLPSPAPAPKPAPLASILVVPAGPLPEAPQLLGS